MARGQLRIVGRNGAGADHDRVAQRAHPVEVQDVFLAGHVLRLAGVGRDEPVEALTEMADGHRPRHVALQIGRYKSMQRMARVGGRQHGFPACAWTPLDRRLAVADSRLSAATRDRVSAAIDARMRRRRVQLGRTVQPRWPRREHNRPRLILNGELHGYCLVV